MHYSHLPIFTGLAAAALLALPVEARKLAVGPGKTYAVPSAAAAAVQDGDTVEIDPGVYAGDVCTWSRNRLVLRGTAPYAHLRADGVNARGKGIWVITGSDVLVENIEFSGATVPDENGAGIRQEGRNVTIRKCYFHDNENGILTDAGDSEILIEYCEFNNNGFGDGFTHNMYIGAVKSFTLRHSFTHHAKIGHNVKSRALRNVIAYNRISDDADGTASYSLDLPNGGPSFVIGNVFQQSPSTDNPTLLAYGAEGLKNAGSALYVVNNTFVNDRSSGTFISVSSGTSPVKIVNNLFVGPGTRISGTATDTAGNLATNSPGFLDKANYDYRLTAGSPAIDKGQDPGSVDSFSLTPTFQYAHPSGSRARPTVGRLDVGAFEFETGTRISPPKQRGGLGYGPASRGAKIVFDGGRMRIESPSAMGRTRETPDSEARSLLDFKGRELAPGSGRNQPIEPALPLSPKSP